MTIKLHKGDIPEDLKPNGAIAVDSETMGLKHYRDPLCVVQFCLGDGIAHVVQMDRDNYDAPNLKALLSGPDIKIFHYARFDVAILKTYLGVECTPVYCTRTASKLVRTYTDRHGLREVCKELLGVELNKQQQSSYWGNDELSENQLTYAANDVLYLHALMEEFDRRLAREGRVELAQRCFDFISLRAELDLLGWGSVDIFEH